MLLLDFYIANLGPLIEAALFPLAKGKENTFDSLSSASSNGSGLKNVIKIYTTHRCYNKNINKKKIVQGFKKWYSKECLWLSMIFIML